MTGRRKREYFSSPGFVCPEGCTHVEPTIPDRQPDCYACTLKGWSLWQGCSGILNSSKLHPRWWNCCTRRAANLSLRPNVRV
ncbi:hypothetical protein M752DRAFT_62902 [Aspergillus phoenicis ATCC 13157]|uniref:Uncharacterized protein n=1 Tax=Aspergillus phoenicis ATCC 13157 TaxID=1353007 RepID=A0A370PX05_ASPPH|nr:hypothetical protein M752DRAFT_62902 [Aspergillus phoenicis ATCC 13157]